MNFLEENIPEDGIIKIIDNFKANNEGLILFEILFETFELKIKLLEHDPKYANYTYKIANKKLSFDGECLYFLEQSPKDTLEQLLYIYFSYYDDEDIKHSSVHKKVNMIIKYLNKVYKSLCFTKEEIENLKTYLKQYR